MTAAGLLGAGLIVVGVGVEVVTVEVVTVEAVLPRRRRRVVQAAHARKGVPRTRTLRPASRSQPHVRHVARPAQYASVCGPPHVLQVNRGLGRRDGWRVSNIQAPRRACHRANTCGRALVGCGWRAFPRWTRVKPSFVPVAGAGVGVVVVVRVGEL